MIFVNDMEKYTKWNFVEIGMCVFMRFEKCFG